MCTAVMHAVLVHAVVMRANGFLPSGSEDLSDLGFDDFGSAAALAPNERERSDATSNQLPGPLAAPQSSATNENPWRDGCFPDVPHRLATIAELPDTPETRETPDARNSVGTAPSDLRMTRDSCETRGSSRCPA